MPPHPPPSRTHHGTKRIVTEPLNPRAAFGRPLRTTGQDTQRLVLRLQAYGITTVSMA
jgi:hypothetical protein